jgi:membrane associated rhomboid family serine protease
MSYSYSTLEFEPRRMGPGLRWLIVITAACYVLELLAELFGGAKWYSFIVGFFGLSRPGIAELWLWQFVTYMFLHQPMIWHVLFNMIGLFFFGRDLEMNMGTMRFLLLYFMSGILGGLGWLMLDQSGYPCIGASGAVFGVTFAFATFYPHQRVTLLIFFVLPLTISARTMALGFAAINVISMMGGGEENVAYAAHLAGGFAGWLYALALKRSGRLYMRGVPASIGWFRSLKAKFWRWYRGYTLRVLGSDDEYVPAREEVDRILEQVTERGLNSLSKKDRAILDLASRRGGESGGVDR